MKIEEMINRYSTEWPKDCRDEFIRSIESYGRFDEGFKNLLNILMLLYHGQNYTVKSIPCTLGLGKPMWQHSISISGPNIQTKIYIAENYMKISSNSPSWHISHYTITINKIWTAQVSGGSVLAYYCWLLTESAKKRYQRADMEKQVRWSMGRLAEIVAQLEQPVR